MQQYDQSEIEKSMLEFWEKNKIPNRLGQMRPNAKPFFLLDGPPYANAQPHVGHVKTTVCKDVWSRYKQMQGFASYFQAGFDCHGLPTEVMVEKELGITSKGDIEKIGIEKFDAICLEKVLNTEKGWMEYYRKLGAWRFYAEPYFTYRDYYIQSGWWSVKMLHEKGLLVEGEKPVYWCSHCETTLSGYEVSDSYKDFSDPSVFLKFKVKGKENEFLLVWTTTPWTLAGNVAIVLHPTEIYVKAKVGAEIFILGEKRLEAVLTQKAKVQYQIIEKLKGSDLEGLEYEPILDCEEQANLDSRARKVRLSIQIMTSKKYKKHKLTHKKDEANKEVSQNFEGARNLEQKFTSANGGNKASEQIGNTAAASSKASSPTPLNSQKLDIDKLTGTEEKEEFEEFVSMNEGTGLVHCAPGHGQTDYFLGKYYDLPVVSPVDEHGKFTAKAGEFAGIYVKSADEKIIEKLKSQNRLLFSERTMHRAALCWRCKTQLIFRLSKQWYLKAEPIRDLMISQNDRHVKWMPEYGKGKFHNWLVDREDWAISQQRYWGIPLPIWICKNCAKFDVIGSKEELIARSTKKLSQGDLSDLHRHTVDKILLKCKNCDGEMARVKDILNVWFDSGIAPWASLGYPFKNKELFEKMFPMDLITESQDQIRGWFDSLMFTSVGIFGKSPYKSVGMMGWVLDEKGEKMSKSLGNVISANEGIEKLSADVIRMYYCYEIAPWEVQKFSLKTAEEIRRAFAILFNSFTFYKMYSENLTVAKPILSALRPEDKWILSKLNIMEEKARQHLEKFEFHLAGREMIGFIVDDYSRTYIKLIRDRVSMPGATPDKMNCLAVMRQVIFEYSKVIAPISPFISEYLYQQLKTAGGLESVHFEDFPKMDEGVVDLNLVEKFAIVSKITEATNSLRQEVKMKLRWPIEELAVFGDEKVEAAVRELNEVLKVSNNAENVVFAKNAEFASKEFEFGEVYIPRHLSEKALIGAAFRELTRAIQSERKKNKFIVNDRIAITIWSNNQLIREFLAKSKEELMLEVGASIVQTKMLESELVGEFSLALDLTELKEGIKIGVKFSKA